MNLFVIVLCFQCAWTFQSTPDSELPDRLRKRSPQRGKSSFDLKEIVDFVYRSERWNGTWVSEDEYIYRNQNGDLAKLSVSSGDSVSLVPSQVLDDPRVFRYWLSPDQRYVLLAFRPQKLFRHSFIALYDIYNIRNGQRIKLEPNLGPGPKQKESPQLPLLYATWSPAGHSLAYVFSNNIFYRPSPEADDQQITDTGIPGTIFNGIADWVYEEEVLGDTKALWFNPNGDKLTWVEFNDTEVEVMPLVIYGQPGRLEFQYPIPTPLRYPKPGRTNPFVNVYVANLEGAGIGRQSTSQKILLPPPAYFEDSERIIYSVGWASNSEISLTWENRHQNYSVVSICDTLLPRCRDSLVLTEPNGWMELREAPVFTSDGRQFAIVSSSDGFKHVNVVNRDTNQRIPITSGKMVVTKIYHWDEDSHLIFFRATRPDAPGERHLYTVTDFESGRPGLITCLSCDVKNSRGGACGYNSFKFSKDNSYYTLTCEGPHVPQDFLFKSPDKLLGILVSNEQLSESLALKNLPKISNLDVKINNGKDVAKVRLYLPHDFDDSKRYPMLVNVYGGPNSQQVNDRFKLDWGTYLTTSQKVIYAVIDGRGSGYRGDELLFSIHRNIGNPEAQDQIDVTEKLLSLYSFINPDKVAIWGWSYGGFLTTRILQKDTDQRNIFKCGIAVAPVSNWIYYDSIYTERYLGLPTPNDNARGYFTSDVTQQAEKLRNKSLLIVHGTGDDNVHYQNSMMLVRALEEKDVLFRELSYPDENHGIVGLRPHLYHSLTDFLLNGCNFK